MEVNPFYMAADPGFERLLRRARGRVQARRGARSVLTGLTLGAGLGALGSGVLWWMGRSEWLVWSWVPAVVGSVAGALQAFRTRWSDEEVALFLDARWHTDEALTSAVATRNETTALASTLRARARAVLEAADPRTARPRLLRPFHAVALAGAATTVLFAALPAPPARAQLPPPKGAQLVRKENVPGLERIEALERSEGLSRADAERLRKLARDAQSLRRDLARGLEKREAQSRLGQLREEIARERQRFGVASERPGVEAAANALSAREATRAAAKALEEGDVIAFDEEMQRLANRAEEDARKQAREALEEAQERAREKGSAQTAELLERQRRLFAERERAARALRELAELMERKLDAAGRRALEDFGQQGDPEAARRLAEALADAVAELTPEQRERLAEALRKRLEGATPDSATPADPEALRDLAERLSSEAGRQALREALEDLLEEPSPDARRERALEDAERGGAEAERGLMPLPGGSGSPGPGSQPGTSSNGQSGNSPSGAAGPGGGKGTRGSKDAGAGEPTPNADEFRAKVNAELLPGSPLPTRSLGRAPARAGETATQAGTGELGRVGPKEISAVENSDVPEEYREHVGRYFQP